MAHVPLLINIGLALGYALLGGLAARRLGLPTIVGYLFAGVALGPFTPGFTGDIEAIQQLAELGVILLMFGIGLHFSLSDLWRVRDIAIPGALIQMGIATAVGYWMAVNWWGWSPSAALVMGVSISVASTVVLLRGLMDLGALETPHGRVAVGWLVLEDLATVAILVLLPAFLSADRSGGWGTAALAIGKAVAFIALMLFIGKRVIPWLLGAIADTQSRELFVLVALTAAVGTALASAEVFGVSLALGAFVAGVVVSESPFSHQVGADLLPFREAFAVLFFVSVGMLVNPAYLWQNWPQVAAITALIVIGKSLIAAVVGFAFPYPARTALIVGAGLSQIGEFSFIVGTLGLTLGLLPAGGFQLIVAGALLSITLNPVLFALIEPLDRRLRDQPWLRALMRRRIGDLAAIDEGQRASLVNHAVICGYGRVGRLIGPALERRGFKYAVITQERDEVDRLRAAGVIAIYGDAAHPEVLRMANVTAARLVVVAIPEPNATRLIVERVQALDPGVDIVVRTHSDSEAAHLRSLGGKVQAVHGERELAVQMARYSLRRFGLSSREAEAVAQGLRGRAVVAPERRRRPLEGVVGRVRDRFSARRV